MSSGRGHGLGGRSRRAAGAGTDWVTRGLHAANLSACLSWAPVAGRGHSRHWMQFSFPATWHLISDRGDHLVFFCVCRVGGGYSSPEEVELIYLFSDKRMTGKEISPFPDPKGWKGPCYQ